MRNLGRQLVYAFCVVVVALSLNAVLWVVLADLEERHRVVCGVLGYGILVGFTCLGLARAIVLGQDFLLSAFAPLTPALFYRKNRGRVGGILYPFLIAGPSLFFFGAEGTTDSLLTGANGLLSVLLLFLAIRHELITEDWWTRWYFWPRSMVAFLWRRRPGLTLLGTGMFTAWLLCGGGNIAGWNAIEAILVAVDRLGLIGDLLLYLTLPFALPALFLFKFETSITPAELLVVQAGLFLIVMLANVMRSEEFPLSLRIHHDWNLWQKYGEEYESSLQDVEAPTPEESTFLQDCNSPVSGVEAPHDLPPSGNLEPFEYQDDIPSYRVLVESREQWRRNQVLQGEKKRHRRVTWFALSVWLAFCHITSFLALPFAMVAYFLSAAYLFITLFHSAAETDRERMLTAFIPVHGRDYARSKLPLISIDNTGQWILLVCAMILTSVGPWLVAILLALFIALIRLFTYFIDRLGSKIDVSILAIGNLYQMILFMLTVVPTCLYLIYLIAEAGGAREVFSSSALILPALLAFFIIGMLAWVFRIALPLLMTLRLLRYRNNSPVLSYKQGG